MEIKLCPLTGSMKEATEECFEKYPLRIMPHPRRLPDDEFKISVEFGVNPPLGQSGPFINESFR